MDDTDSDMVIIHVMDDDSIITTQDPSGGVANEQDIKERKRKSSDDHTDNNNITSKPRVDTEEESNTGAPPGLVSTNNNINSVTLDQALNCGMVSMHMDGKIKIYKCNVCDLMANGPRTMTSHVLGQKHLKKLKNDPRKVAEYKRALASGGTVRLLTVENKSATGVMQVDTEVVHSVVPIKASIKPAAEPRLGTAVAASFAESRKVNDGYWCEVCLLCTTTKKLMMTHMAGSNHKKKLASYKLLLDPVSGVVKCLVCSQEMATPQKLKAHLAEDVHENRTQDTAAAAGATQVAAAGAGPVTATTAPTADTEVVHSVVYVKAGVEPVAALGAGMVTADAAPASDVDVVDGIVSVKAGVEPVAAAREGTMAATSTAEFTKVNGEYWCEICHLSATTQKLMMTHMAGYNHKKKLNLQKSGQQEDPVSGVQKGVVNRQMARPQEVNGHLAGDVHRIRAINTAAAAGATQVAAAGAGPVTATTAPTADTEVVHSVVSVKAGVEPVAAARERTMAATSLVGIFCVNGEYWCEICHLSATTQKLMMTHMAGYNHKKKLNLQKSGQQDPVSGVQKGVVNRQMARPQEVKGHLAGDVHRIRAKNTAAAAERENVNKDLDNTAASSIKQYINSADGKFKNMSDCRSPDSRPRSRSADRQYKRSRSRSPDIRYLRSRSRERRCKDSGAQKNPNEFSAFEACQLLMGFCDKIGILGISLRMALEKTVKFGNNSHKILESLCDSESQELLILIAHKCKRLKEETAKQQDSILLAKYIQACIAIDSLVEATKLQLEASNLASKLTAYFPSSSNPPLFPLPPPDIKSNVNRSSVSDIYNIASRSNVDDISRDVNRSSESNMYNTASRSNVADKRSFANRSSDSDIYNTSAYIASSSNPPLFSIPPPDMKSNANRNSHSDMHNTVSRTNVADLRSNANRSRDSDMYNTASRTNVADTRMIADRSSDYNMYNIASRSNVSNISSTANKSNVDTRSSAFIKDYGHSSLPPRALQGKNLELDSGSEYRLRNTNQNFQNSGYSPPCSDSTQRFINNMFKVAIFGHEYIKLLPFCSGETFKSKTPDNPYQVIKYIRHGAEIFKVQEYSIWNEVISAQPHMIFLILGKHDISAFTSPLELSDRMVRIRSELEKRITNVRIVCFGLEDRKFDSQWSSYQDKLNRCLGIGFEILIFPNVLIDIGSNSYEAVKKVWSHMQGIIEDVQLQQTRFYQP